MSLSLRRGEDIAFSSNHLIVLAVAPTIMIHRSAIVVAKVLMTVLCQTEFIVICRSDYRESQRHRLCYISNCTRPPSSGVVPHRALSACNRRTALLAHPHLDFIRLRLWRRGNQRSTLRHDEYGVITSLNSGTVWLIFPAVVSICLFRIGGVNRGLFFLSQR